MCKVGCCDTTIKTPTLVFTEWKNRGCTDIPCLLAFLAGWAVVIAILVSAIKDGSEPKKVLYPVDYAGRICGFDEGVQNASFGAWPHPSFFKLKICVENCNQTQIPGYVSPSGGQMIKTYHTTKFLKFCLPSLVQGRIDIRVTVTGDFEAIPELASRTMADLYLTWPVIFASGGIALVLAYFYIWLAKYFARCLLWSAVLLLIAGGFLTGFSFLRKAKAADDSVSTPRAKAMWIVGCILIAATVAFLCVIIFLRQRIEIALEVVKESARALQDMRLIIFFPLIPWIIAICYFAWWIVVAVNIFAVKVVEELPWPDCANSAFPICLPAITTDQWNTTYGYIGNGYQDQDLNQKYQKAFAVHFFHLLWNVQFLVYFTYVVVAGAIANWYFTPRDKDGEKMRGTGHQQLSYFPVSASFFRTLRFHAGSIAFGAAIIATIQFIRAVVTYIETKATVVSGQKPTRLQKALFCCLQCCLKCLQCCIDKINKNAYVWMSIWGDGFVTSTCNSFMLIWENLARVAAFNAVGAYLLMLGKVVVALLTTGIAGLLMQHFYDDELNSNVMPLVLVFVGSYIVSSLFMQIFDTVVDTMFICFLVDDKYNGGTDQMLASPELQRLVNSYSTRSELKAIETKKLKHQIQAGQESGATPNDSATAAPANVEPTKAGTSYV